jgi:hypothetical protein
VPVYFTLVIAANPLRAWAVAVLGVAFEWIFVSYFLKQTWGKALGIVVVANLVSTIAGFFLVLLIGIPFEMVIGELLGLKGSVGVFILFGFTQLVLIAANTAIEPPILFKFGVPRELRSWKVIFWVNVVSVLLLLLGSLQLF